MNKHFASILSAVTLVVIFHCGTPLAVSQSYNLTVDDDPSASGGVLTGAVDGSAIFLAVATARSYCCTIQAGNQLTETPAFSSLVQYNIFPLIATSRGNNEPILRSSLQRICMTTPDDIIPSGTLVVSLDFITLPTDMRARCEETTLFGGYNTSVTDFNFLELRSLLAEGTIAGRIRGSNSSGTPNIDVPFTLNPGLRQDIDIHTLVGPGNFGPIVVTHDGPPGALHAVLNQYKITTTNPLTFIPVSQEVFITRSSRMSR